MLFHSAPFLVFFAVFLLLFVRLAPAHRIWATLIASYVFYGWWNPLYLFLLAGFSIAAFVAAPRVGRLPKPGFALVILLALVPLVFFKYAHFIWENVPWVRVLHPVEPVRHALPLGISFITFTVLAYLVDVRKGVYRTRETFERVALYISFFPHLIAGPIMRPRELFPQFAHLRINPKLAKIGVLLFAVGLVKKTIFADTLSRVVDAAYRQDAAVSWLDSALAVYGFAVQVYCDFSGYVDMALGLAFILGVRLPLNFNRPYLAVSIRDFWKRWHMTLSRWLKDYLYIPLGGNRKGPARTYLNLMATMLIGGLWHGAAWTFVIWGGYHGVLLAAEHALERVWKNGFRIPAPVRIFVTLHLVVISWVFFRARDLGQARRILSGFFSGIPPADTAYAVFPLLLIALFFVLHRFDRVSLVCWFAKRFGALPVYGLALSLLVVGLSLSVGNANAFIYFDF